MAPVVVLGHHATSSPEAMLVRSQSVFTLTWELVGWRRLSSGQSSERTYPPEIRNFLAASIPAADPF